MKRKRSTTKDSCRRDCIANMIGRDPKSVPDFVNKYGKNTRLKETFKYLDKLGYVLIKCRSRELIERFFMPVGYHIRTGQSINGRRHACIYHANILMFDPITPQFGLQEGTVENYYFITQKKDRFQQMPID